MNALKLIDIPEDRPSLALNLPEQTSFDEWIAIGRKLCLGSQALNWHIGDWWRHGVAHFGEDDTRAAALDIWGVEGETARVYGWVAAKFDAVNRLTNLSFTHYQRAASLPSEDAFRLIERAAAEHLSVRDVQREVQALKAANDPERSETAPPVQVVPPSKEIPSQTARAELIGAYEMVVEFAEALTQVRPLTRRENDLLSVAMAFLGEAHAGHRACPDDFDVIFVEKGRLECEAWYTASRLTVNRWLIERGKRRLIEQRAAFIRYQREQAHPHVEAAPPTEHLPIDEALQPIARQAAQFLRISRYGGWTITQGQDGYWLVGTVRRTPDELIAMAERQGFESDAALQSSSAEGVN